MAPTSLTLRAQVRTFVDGMRRHLWLVVLVGAFSGAVGVLAGSGNGGRFRAETEVQLYREATQKILESTFGIEGLPSGSRFADIEEFSRSTTDRWQQEGRAVTVSLSRNMDNDIAILKVTAPTKIKAIANANELAELFVAASRKSGSELIAVTEGALRERLDDLDASLAMDDRSQRAELLERRQVVIEGLEALALARELGRQSNAAVLTPAASAVPAGRGGMGATRTGVIALVIGLVIGLAIALLRISYDTVIRQAADLHDALPGLPLLAAVPMARARAKDSPMVQTVAGDFSSQAEAFRRLRASIFALTSSRKWRSLLITGPTGGEGKTTTVANLGTALSRSGLKVLVVDTDVRGRALTRVLGCDESPGLAEVLFEAFAVSEAVQCCAHAAGLSVLSPGKCDTASTDLLATASLPALLQDLQADFDLLLVDAPALVRGSEALTLAHVVDATVLVVAVNATDTRDLVTAHELLTNLDVEVAGAILTGVDVEVYSRKGGLS